VPVNRQEKEAVLFAHYCVIENRNKTLGHISHRKTEELDY